MPARRLAALLAAGAVPAHAMGGKPVQQKPLDGPRAGTRARSAAGQDPARNQQQPSRRGAGRDRTRSCKAYPNFRLAHLIKGDLLLARARPLTTLGDAQGAARTASPTCATKPGPACARYQQKPPGDRVPRYLLQLKPEQKYAFVVDTREIHALRVRKSQRRRRATSPTTTSASARTAPTNSAKATRKRRSASITSPTICRATSSPTSTARRLPDQLSERMGPAPGPQRQRHLAARHAVATPTAARRARATAAWC